MFLGFTQEQILLIICYILLIFNLLKFIKNIRKKVKNKKKEGFVENLKETKKGLAKKSKPKPKPEPKPKPKPKTEEKVPEPANTNVASHLSGIRQYSGGYNGIVFNKLEDQVNRLLMKDYGTNYLQILDRFKYLLTLKMLDSTLTVDFDNDKQMLKKVDNISKYGDAKKFIDEMKKIVEIEITPQNQNTG